MTITVYKVGETFRARYSGLDARAFLASIGVAVGGMGEAGHVNVTTEQVALINARTK